MHFCATCDGPFYRDREVLVIGGGNSAAEEGIFLTRFASKVTIVTRGAGLSASKVVVEKVAESPKIELLTHATPVAFKGDSHLERVVVKGADGQERELTPAGVFVFIGLSPNTGVVKDLVTLDERGFVVTKPMLETSVPGIFPAGDCRAGSTKQAASAAGEGAAVALMIRRYVEPLAGGRPVSEAMASA